MMFSVVFVLLVSVIVSANPQPHELVGGMNPEFGDFLPPTPIVNTSGTGDASVDNYPHCGVYESECYDRLIASKKYTWTFSGYEESVPSFLQFNVTYYTNRSCNSTRQYLHMSYTWYVISIENNWQDWTVNGNNLFIKVLSDDVANTLRCEKGVMVNHEVMSVQELVCVDVGPNGIMVNYAKHFNKTRLLHLRFNKDVLVSVSNDYIPPIGVLGSLDSVFTGGTVEPNVQYKRVEDFGCCQQEESSNTALIVGIVVGSVVIVAVVVVTLVMIFKPRKVLPKKTVGPTKV